MLSPPQYLPKVLKLAPWGLVYFWIFAWGFIPKGDFKNLETFLVVGHFPVEAFLLTNYFFDGTHTSSRIFLRDRQIFVN